MRNVARNDADFDPYGLNAEPTRDALSCHGLAVLRLAVSNTFSTPSVARTPATVAPLRRSSVPKPGGARSPDAVAMRVCPATTCQALSIHGRRPFRPRSKCPVSVASAGGIGASSVSSARFVPTIRYPVSERRWPPAVPTLALPVKSCRRARETFLIRANRACADDLAGDEPGRDQVAKGVLKGRHRQRERAPPGRPIPRQPDLAVVGDLGAEVRCFRVHIAIRAQRHAE